MKPIRFQHILSQPKTRPLFRSILLVASVYVVVSLTVWSNSGGQPKTSVVPAKLREASMSTLQIISQYARRPASTGAPRRAKQKQRPRLQDARGGIAATGQHKYHQNGLLEVNAKGPHPIYELMDRAEAQWKKKVSKASRTLEQAVREYRRRYKRNPPKDFDVWCAYTPAFVCLALIFGRWKFVQQHNVQLPDEYDQIYHDFEHLWGIYPPDLIALQDEQQNATQQDWYLIGRDEEGHVGVVRTSFSDDHQHLISGSFTILKLLGEVEEWLPENFTIMVSPHDGPSRLTDYLYKQKLLDAAWRKTCQ